MPTPVRSRSSSPVHDEYTEEVATTASASASPAVLAQESAIPGFFQPLLRARSPVRDLAHAQRRWGELPDEHQPQSTLEADRLLQGLGTSFNMPEGHPLRIDYETYRQLVEPLRVQAENLPPVRPSPRSKELTAFAGQIHLLDGDDHLGAFATVLKAVGEELPHDQQGVPLGALIKETGELPEGLQKILRNGLFHYIKQLPAEQQNKPMRALADRLGESASQIRLPENSSDLEPFKSVLSDIERLPDNCRGAPLARLVAVIDSQPERHYEPLMELVKGPIQGLSRGGGRREAMQAFADLLD
ncbi:hypothetical protein [Paraburkholderia sp.]|uniref:hypothetical protein n=1 Tax=Paraburkholderia sp. TaxID=1926495 RepID=UPI003D6E10F0